MVLTRSSALKAGFGRYLNDPKYLSTIVPGAGSASLPDLTSAKLNIPGGSAVHFDTYHVIQRLERKGFSMEQSKAILEVMTIAMAESLQTQGLVVRTVNKICRVNMYPTS